MGGLLLLRPGVVVHRMPGFLSLGALAGLCLRRFVGCTVSVFLCLIIVGCSLLIFNAAVIAA